MTEIVSLLFLELLPFHDDFYQKKTIIEHAGERYKLFIFQTTVICFLYINFTLLCLCIKKIPLDTILFYLILYF